MCEELQEDHKKLSVQRHVQFNVGQYGVMDMGKILNSRKRNDGFSVDPVIILEEYLWIEIFYENSVLNSLQKPKQILENFRKGTNKTDNELIQLHESFVCQHLKCCVEFWSAYFKMDSIKV